MRHLAPLCLIALLLAAHLARAQEASPTIPDVPAGPATVRGRLVHEAGARGPLGGAGVSLYALSPTGVPGVREGVTDAEGRFVFEAVSNDPSSPYLIGVQYQGVTYTSSRVVFRSGELEREVEIPVADVTTEAQQVSLRLAQFLVEWRGSELRVMESLTIHNGSSRTVYVPSVDRGGRPPVLRADLPEGAEDFRMPHGLVPEGVDQREGEIAFWGPVYPGEQSLGFSYALPASGGKADLDAVFPTGAERIEVLVPPGGPSPSGQGLTEKERRSAEGRSLRVFEAPALAPGERLAVALDLPEVRTDADALGVAEARLILHLDDAALEVRETHVLRVEGDPGVAAAPGEALLKIHLPEGSQNVRSATDAAGLTLERLPEGGVAVGGVAPPGESSVEVSYRIPVTGDSVELTRSFEKPVPLLSIFLADTGRLILESDRLHRRSPAPTGDLTYIHLEAFSVAPGEEVPLRISSRPPSPGSSWGGVMAFVLVAGVLSGALLITPLLGRGLGPEQPEAEASPIVREREAIYAAIRDLEHDHETGKIAESDYASMRDELRARAVTLLREERDGRGTDTGTEEGSSAPPLCPSCSAPVRSTDRFCSRCGTALAADPTGEAVG